MEYKQTYNLFLDDYRIARDAFIYTHDVRFNLLTWVIVRSYDEFVNKIKEKIKEGEFPELIAFDNDLADEHYNSETPPGGYKEKTGFECAKWLVDFCLDKNIILPEYIVHSQNPAGKANIVGLLDGFKKFQEKNNI